MTANSTAYLDDGDVQLHHGDATTVLQSLPSGIAQTCITSPPYWGLRDYGTGTWTGGDAACDHAPKAASRATRPARGLEGGKATVDAGTIQRDRCRCGAQRTDDQLGLEATPDQYVAKMVAVFREVRRCLRDDGTLWLNLGDSYAANRTYQVTDNKHTEVGNNGAMSVPDGLKPKDLIGVPWRVAFALQADGWYLRSDIIWAKPNPMPESVTDRPTKAHEYLFLFSKQPRYYYDADAIREPGTSGYPDSHGGAFHDHSDDLARGQRFDTRIRNHCVTPAAGRNRRSVWTIPTDPFPEAHFATYPQELVRPCILAGTSERGGCVECGAPWRRIAQRTLEGGNIAPNARQAVHRADGSVPGGDWGGGPRHVSGSYRVETIGWEPSCSCFSEGGEWTYRAHTALTRPQLVLDPFVGSGTTCLVARKHVRRCIGIDLSAEYLAIAAKRTQQLSLLGGVA